MKDSLRTTAIELVKVQREVIESKAKVFVIFEGRDAAGKDGAIKCVTKNMSPRDTRIVALGKPVDRESRAWYFERYVAHLRVAGEIALFNPSWYNRAGVELVMNFCAPAEYEEFLITVPMYEQLLAHCGFTIVKYYLDICKDEQRKRLREREENPLKQWKCSPVEAEAIHLWREYGVARDAMLKRTSMAFAPCTIVKADDKAAARLAIMQDIVRRLSPDAGSKRRPPPDERILFPFDESPPKSRHVAE
ncbi:MAG: polyphosphate kinase 2 [Aestuariivirga sp.]|nr:polyphosphate kinase 2 [Aestuariivirga sp.]